MHAVTAGASAGGAENPVSDARTRSQWASSSGAASAVAVPVALYTVALLIRLLVIGGVRYPINEGSAYYAAVSGNLVEGRGLVTEALWSFATPPLVVPRPAFELWQPLSSFISAAPMTLFGPSFGAAQLGHAVFGALVAPLCWAVARDASDVLGLSTRRAWAVAVGSGVLAAALGPFLLGTVSPDSTSPFLIMGLLACLLVPRALGGSVPAGLALGITLGFAYLARLEAIYVGLAFLLLVGSRWRVIPPVIVGGLLVTVPWLARNLVSFGTLFPGQALENLFFTRNEDVFAHLDRPSAQTFLAQGWDVIVTNIVTAFVHNLVNVLVIPAAPVAITGLLAGLWLWRKPALRTTALMPLVLSGLLTFAAITILFPVATLWGTFEHAAGPLLAGLVVTAALGADALVARIRELRRWPRSNAWLAQLALIALTLPLTYLLVAPLPGIAAELEQRHSFVAQAVVAQPDVPDRLISDHPVWLAEATGIPSVALPDEPIESLVRLARDLDAPMVVVIDGRGRYPAALRSTEGRTCFEERDLNAPNAALFVLRADCP
jgi:hypothetical protein